MIARQTSRYVHCMVMFIYGCISITKRDFTMTFTRQSSFVLLGILCGAPLVTSACTDGLEDASTDARPRDGAADGLSPDGLESCARGRLLYTRAGCGAQAPLPQCLPRFPADAGLALTYLCGCDGVTTTDGIAGAAFAPYQHTGMCAPNDASPDSAIDAVIDAGG